MSLYDISMWLWSVNSPGLSAQRFRSEISFVVCPSLKAASRIRSAISKSRRCPGREPKVVGPDDGGMQMVVPGHIVQMEQSLMLSYY